MKILKLNHKEAQEIVAKKRTSTIRLYDDKDISVHDELELLDKVDPTDRATWRPIGIGKVTTILEKTIGSITDQDLQSHAVQGTPELLLQELRQHYGPDVSTATPIKIVHFDFTPVKIQMDSNDDKITSITTDTAKEVKLYADGGSRGNPGPSASGYVLYDMQDTIIAREGIYLGITTNNQAEYLALKLGLERALKEQARIVHVYLDSLLVVNQMTGKFKIKNRDLWPIHGAIKELLPKFERINFTHIPRELNKEADRAVNEAMDAELEPQDMV